MTYLEYREECEGIYQQVKFFIPKMLLWGSANLTE